MTIYCFNIYIHSKSSFRKKLCISSYVIVSSSIAAWDYFEIVYNDIAKLHFTMSLVQSQWRMSSGLRQQRSSKHKEEYDYRQGRERKEEKILKTSFKNEKNG